MTDKTILERSLGLFNLEKVDRDIFSWTGKNVGYKRIFGGQPQRVAAAKAPTSELPEDEPISDNDEPIDE